MMDYYICTECGETFEEPHSYTESYGQTLYCCPVCGGGYVEAEFCHDCGRAFEKGDTDGLIAGKYCKECLMDYIDYKSVCDFAIFDANRTKDTEISAAEQFYFAIVCRIGYDCFPKESSATLREDVIKNLKSWCEVKRFASSNYIAAINDDCVGFIFDCDLQDDFAEWIYSKEW